MYPITLPKKSKVIELIVKWCHLKAAHCGRGITLNEIRDRGFWIINASSITKSVVSVLLAANLEERWESK